MDEKLEAVRAWLELRRRELTQGLEHNLEDLQAEGHHLADLEELASDVSADATIFEQFRSSSESIEKIDRAIDRLDEGTYTTCEDCEGEIAPERLEAIPFATQCIDCKRKEEQRAQRGLA